VLEVPTIKIERAHTDVRTWGSFAGAQHLRWPGPSPLLTGGRLDFDRRNLQHFRAEFWNLRASWLAPVRAHALHNRCETAGRRSNQFSLLRNFTTSPMTATVGGPIFSLIATSAMFANVPSIDCW